jgi:hypothetical protein
VHFNRLIAAATGNSLLALVALAASVPASAGPTVALDSAVFVERSEPGAGRRLEPVSQLSRGDRVVYVVTWQRTSGSGSFTVTNPLPRSVYFQGTADGDEQVSVDGARTWGKLEDLRIGSRYATPEDVTHVRWRVPAEVAAQGRGRIAYSAIVR